jgi:hypothetical protein
MQKRDFFLHFFRRRRQNNGVENGLYVVFNICDGVLDRPRHLRLPLETLL